MIFHCFESGLIQQQSSKQIATAFGNEAPSRTTVDNWFAKFCNGRLSLVDDPSSGCQSTETTDVRVAAVRDLLEGDARAAVP